MLKIDGISLSLDSDLEALDKKITRTIGERTEKWHVYKKAVDARKKNDVHFVYSIIAEVKNESSLAEKIKGARVFNEAIFEYPNLKKQTERPIIVGSGPAGSFAALCLAHAGARPIIIERGKCVDKRKDDVKTFFSGGALNTDSNIQFGEGGAGTFSDGKLNTGTNSEYIRKILHEYVRFGAPESILTDSKPHIGTDILEKIAVNLRSEVESLGGTYLFDTQLSRIDVKNGKICGIFAGDYIEASDVILAIGHSARDTFKMLCDSGVAMLQKPFSVGVRIEHPQELINKAQYGSFSHHPALPPADYKFGADCYTFCMCPGGFVVAAASEENSVVTNGMSLSDRGGENANSALLVNVSAEDFGDGIFDGVEFQRKIESAAFDISGSYAAPCQKLSDFLKGFSSTSFGSVKPTYRPGVAMSDITKCLPEKICDSIKSGIVNIDKRLSGFALSDALLTAPETRSSSPVRIVRNTETLMSVNIDGLYPCGEGAGYAGGIMSAAADGIRCASRLIDKLNGDV